MTARADLVAARAESFVNDDLDRLYQEDGAVGYTYEGLSSRLSGVFNVGTYTYDQQQGRDWVKTAGASTFQHDAVGNIWQRNHPNVAGGAQTITYTAFDLPSGITNSNGSTAFFYAASGTRVVKQTPTRTTYYSGDLYQRSIGAGNVVENMWMVYAGGRAVLQATSADGQGNLSDPTLRYLYEDALGSIQTIAGPDGTLLAARHYTPFGVQENAGGLDQEVPYGFTGRQTDADLGLINMRGRIYDPHLGQFLTADPYLSNPQGKGLNRFAYVENAPLNFTDPSGFEVVSQGPTSTGWEYRFADDPLFGYPPNGSGGPASGGSVQASAAAPSSPAAAAAAPAAPAAAPAADAGALADTAPGDAASMGDVIGYGIGNGPGIYNAGKAWADSAKRQDPTNHPVALSGTQPASDAAIGNYGNSPTAVATNTGQDAPAGNPDWGPAPDVSDTAGPFGQAPVENKLLSEAAAQIPDTSESLELEFAVITAIPDVAALGAGIGRYVAKRIFAKVAEEAAEGGALYLRASRAGYRLHGDIPNAGALRERATAELVQLRDLARKASPRGRRSWLDWDRKVAIN